MERSSNNRFWGKYINVDILLTNRQQIKARIVYQVIGRPIPLSNPNLQVRDRKLQLRSSGLKSALQQPTPTIGNRINFDKKARTLPE